MSDEIIVVLVVAVALAFDFTNGFHDTANVVATSISTRAMRPNVAVGYAAVLNFVGAFISLQVAATVPTTWSTRTPSACWRCSRASWGRSPGISPPGTSGCRRARRMR